MADVSSSSPIKSPSPEKLKRDISTPYLLRKLKQTKYAHTMPLQQFDSDESSDSASSHSTSSSSSDESDEVELSVGQRRKVEELDTHLSNKENIESYFHSRRAGKTSNKTLHDLELEEMDHNKITKLLSKMKMGYAKEQAALFAEHTQLFTQWYIYLRQGYNLVCYGVGSKRKLLIQFAKKMLKYEYHIVINGYFPNLTVRDILNSITSEMLGSSASFRSTQDQLNYISNSKYNKIFILINNIDGANLRNEKSQQVLAELSAIEHVHVIATIDHINAPLLWDEQKSKMFNWLWFDCTTFHSYSDETSIETSLMVKQTGAITLSSMTHVLRSLTPNARGIFKLLATFQQESGPDFQGITFQDFYMKCREKFLVNSDATLRTQLTEFKDHMLIKTRHVDGSEVLYIPVEPKILQQFLDSEF
ncbi:hypothetical protein ACHWQZ_G012231 [Mnemiopsis leidyi]